MKSRIHASKDKASQDLVYYVSKDGKHIMQGTSTKPPRIPSSRTWTS